MLSFDKAADAIEPNNMSKHKELQDNHSFMEQKKIIKEPFRQACEKCYLGDTSVDLCPCHYAKEVCSCHTTQPKEKKSYERDCSHYHCWDQKPFSACGYDLKQHEQCCLCDTPAPKTQEVCKRCNTAIGGITVLNNQGLCFPCETDLRKEKFDTKFLGKENKNYDIPSENETTFRIGGTNTPFKPTEEKCVQEVCKNKECICDCHTQNNVVLCVKCEGSHSPTKKEKIYKCFHPHHAELGIKSPCKWCVEIPPKQSEKECEHKYKKIETAFGEKLLCTKCYFSSPTPQKEWTCPCEKPALEFDLCGSAECKEKYTTKDETLDDLKSELIESVLKGQKNIHTNEITFLSQWITPFLPHISSLLSRAKESGYKEGQEKSLSDYIQGK